MVLNNVHGEFVLEGIDEFVRKCATVDDKQSEQTLRFLFLWTRSVSCL